MIKKDSHFCNKNLALSHISSLESTTYMKRPIGSWRRRFLRRPAEHGVFRIGSWVVYLIKRTIRLTYNRSLLEPRVPEGAMKIVSLVGVLLLTASLAFAGEVLIFIDGSRMEVQHYEIRDNIVVITTLDGKLLSVPISYLVLGQRPASPNEPPLTRPTGAACRRWHR